jgi:NAD+ kinase
LNRLGIFTHPSKLEAKAAGEELRELAAQRGLTIVEPRREEKPELIVALGGDGTILHAARFAHENDALLLGINIGRLGFLSTVEAANLEVAIRAMVDGNFRVEERMMLEASGFSGDKRIVALNEFVVERSTPARVIHIFVKVDDAAVANFTADGFIVATPSGSTAYSYSAGGPILEPDVDALVLSPVSPHYPPWRSSLVVTGNRTVQVELNEGMASLTGDGETIADIETGTTVSIKRHPHPLKVAVPSIAESSPDDFFMKLKSRLRFESPAGEEQGGR